jgi:tetratricopeptide (TPR) repeat protein
VGRQDELQRIGALLGAARLVTLTGPGGVGKTRLAVEVAARAPGEVCFVDLALLGGGAQVPQAVLGALGLREAGLLPLAPGPPDPTGRLVTALTDRELLLVLDNCEHSGHLRLFSSEVVQAEAAFGLALEDFRAVGDRWGAAQALDALATLADWRADQAASLALTDEAIDLVGELGALEELAELRRRRADRLLRAGEVAAAGADYQRATELGRRAGMPATLALAHRGLGEIARRRGDLAEAHRLQQTALGLCATDWKNTRARSQVLTALGRVAETEGHAGQARSWHQQALAMALGSGSLPDVAAAAEGLAGAVLGEGDGEQAALLLGVGVGLRGTAVAGDPDIARVATAAQDLIGAGAYASAFGRGAALPRQEALALLGAAPSGA